jgi:hypothetical protein
VHRRLVLEAEEQNISLNRLVSAKLSSPLERPSGGDLREAPAKYRARNRSRA